VFSLAGKEYTLGVLIQSNYGLLKDLSINGKKIGLEIGKKIKLKKEEDKGSIIIIIATDLPVSSRQLNRICKRAAVGLIRTGSYIGNGSGDIIIGFSTANVIKYKEEIADDDLDCIINQKILNENKINIPFRAVSEATEEAILNSMITAGEVIGYKGNKRFSLKSYIDLL
jgi:D-aminopeptidase